MSIGERSELAFSERRHFLRVNGRNRKTDESLGRRCSASLVCSGVDSQANGNRSGLAYRGVYGHDLESIPGLYGRTDSYGGEDRRGLRNGRFGEGFRVYRIDFFTGIQEAET